ncbi:MAG: thioredoxin domain-containing protein [Candidatus Kaiserbacteria bacterium]|nr:thioredoxin domain-containing protein [Candidatus Kaiserbacteria bacterium]
MQEAQGEKKKKMHGIIVDATILTVALLISTVLMVQHSNAVQVMVDTREDRYFRPINPNIDLLFGNPEADLFIVEYGDLECPYCKEFHAQAKTLIKSDWGISGKVAWVWRNGFHINETSLKKAQTLECIRLHAGEQARLAAWKFIEESLIGGVMEDAYPHDRYKMIMDRLNIPFNEVEQCRKEGKDIAPYILQAIQDVRKLNIDETPYIQFISGSGELLFESVGSLTTAQLESYIANILQNNKKR